MDINVTERTKPGALFWVAAVLFLIWNAFGCYAYILDQTMSEAAYIQAYGADMAAVRDQYPVWSVAAYAIAVWGGLLAAILMLLKRRWAAPLFVLSLVAAVISFAWALINPEARAAAGSTVWVMPLLVVVIGLVEIVVSRRYAARGVLA